MSKTNVQYLRDIIKDNDEACEFLDAIENELKEANDGWDHSERERNKLQDSSDEIERELNEIKESGPGNIIRTPQGNINWDADNLQLQAIMESLEEKLKTTSPVEIARILDFNAVSDPKY